MNNYDANNILKIISIKDICAQINGLTVFAISLTQYMPFNFTKGDFLTQLIKFSFNIPTRVLVPTVTL